MTSNVLLPWIHSAGEDGERKSIQSFQGNGTTGPWEFNFAGGYIERSHVKAYRYDPASATSHPQVLTFIGQNQVTTSDAIPPTQYLVLYRDTPKDTPLVDYNEGAVLNEKNLDVTAQQAVFAAAEMVDRFDSVNVTSNDAIQRSVLALDTANTALGNSATAVSDAANAVTTANAASAAATDAVTTANAAAATANGIDAKAQLALDTSIEAVNTATMAYSTAISIDAKATQAQTDAAAALTAATSAEAKAGTKIPDLPEAPNVNDAQQFEVNDGGDSYRVNFQMVHNELKNRFDGDYAALNHNHDGVYAPANHTHTAAQISNASQVGQSVLTAANAAAARAAIGAGTSNLTLGYSAAQAKPGNWVPDINGTSGYLPYWRVTGGPSAALPDAFAVGSYTLSYVTTEPLIPVGGVFAGSRISNGGGAPGTWRNMGALRAGKQNYGGPSKPKIDMSSTPNVFLRIA